MRKILISFFALLASCQLLFSDGGQSLRMDFRQQQIAGYINASAYLFVENVTDVYDPSNPSDKGIDLDIFSSSSNYKYLIAPTATAKTELGLLVGHFSFTSPPGQNYSIVISHDKLHNMLDDTDHSNDIDYELGIYYTLRTTQNDGAKKVINVENAVSEISLSNETMEIDISNWVSVVVIKNGGIYFRLRAPVETAGTYTSTVTFSLESN